MANLNTETVIGAASSCLKQDAGSVLDLAYSGVWEAGSGHHASPLTKTKNIKTKLRVTT